MLARTTRETTGEEALTAVGLDGAVIESLYLDGGTFLDTGIKDTVDGGTFLGPPPEDTIDGGVF